MEDYNVIPKYYLSFSFSRFIINNREVMHTVVFFSQIKSKVGNILVKSVGLCMDLNIDGVTIESRSHTHPHTPKPLTFQHRLYPCPHTKIGTG